MKRIIVVFIMVLFAACAAFAQSSDTAAGTARSGIIVPLSVAILRNPSFGTFVPPTVDSVIRWIGNESANYRVISGQAHQVVTPHTSGQFRTSGMPGAQYTATLTSDGALTSENNDTIGYLAMYCTQSTYANLTIPPSGMQEIRYMCGQLSLAANQAPGTYSGAYTLTVSYN